MERARRLYLYFVSAVSLLALSVGLSNLLEAVFERIADSWDGNDFLSGDPDVLRRQLSASAALILIALPIWLLHWWLAERSLGPSNAEADQERAAESRSIYLALVLLVAFAAWTITGIDLLRDVIAEIVGSGESVRDFDGDADRLAILLVAGAVWTYHARVRLRDARSGPIPRGSDQWPRLYVYIAAFVGTMLLVFGTSDLLQLVVDVVVGNNRTITGGRWWAPELADSIAQVLAGFLVWAVHWSYTLQLLHQQDWRGSRERHSGLRRFYLYLAAFVGVFVALLLIAEVVEGLLREILDAVEAGDEPLGERLIEPLAGALPFVALWYIHRERVLSESREYEEIGPQATVRRIYSYVIALIGLAIAGYGLAGTIAIAIDRLTEGSGTVRVAGDPWRGEISRLVPLAAIGAVAWLWHWYRAQGWVEDDPAAERGATVRRAYLYATLAAAIVALLASVAVIAYRIFTALLDVSPDSGLGSDLSVPIGVAVVAGALVGYHVGVLRRDLRAHMEPAPDAQTLPVVITGPPGADLDAVVAQLGARLPEGYSIRTLPDREES